MEKTLDNNGQNNSKLPDSVLCSRNFYIKYGRKNGLVHLKLLMEHLSGDALMAAKDAYNYLDNCYRNERAKGQGSYK